jgi:hypothetical protein
MAVLPVGILSNEMNDERTAQNIGPLSQAYVDAV